MSEDRRSNAMTDKQDAEIEALEREMYPELFKDKKEPEVDEVITDDQEVIEDEEVETVPEDLEVVEDLSEAETEAEEVVVEEGSDEELEEGERPKRKSWKGEYKQLEVRYSNLRSATDSKLFALRNEKAALLTEIDGLEAQVTELRNQLVTVNANTDIYADIFTEEDVDVLGEDAINVFKRANKKSLETALAPLKQQLESARTQGIKARKGEAEVERQQAYGLFLSGLERLVPDYNDLNFDDGFKKYMGEVEPGGDKARQDELADAVTLGNVRWAATFFNEYKALRAIPKSKLDAKLMPKSSSASVVKTNKSGKKTYPFAEYESFMDKLTRGGYNTSKESKKIGEQLEAMYDRALAEGRVV